jgi:hypothetical protein
MHVVRGDLVVEHAQVVALARLEQPPHPLTPIAGELQQELTAMAPSP